MNVNVAGDDIKRVLLPASEHAFSLIGFSKDYSAFVTQWKIEHRRYPAIGWPLMAIGGGLALTVLVTFFSAPKTIYYNPANGLSLLQYLQLYPGPFGIMSMAITIIAKAMIPIPPPDQVEFATSHYTFIDSLGETCNQGLVLKHVQGETFYVVSQPSGRPASA